MRLFEQTGFAVLAFAAGTAVAIEPKITVAFPAAGATVATERQTYVIGAVTPPDTPIRVNSQTVVPYRTGSFIFMTPVVHGTNTLLLRAGTAELRHTFQVPVPPPSWNGASIRVRQPIQPIGVYTGETIRLSCLAPTGLTVCAAIGERTLCLAPRIDRPTQYDGHVTFDMPVEKAPVVFYAKGLADAPAADLTARAEWPVLKVIGPLFATRARSEPGDGDTVAFLPDGFRLPGAGFNGSHTRFWLGGSQRFVESVHLCADSHAHPSPSREQPVPDIATGFGPHPPTNRSPSAILIVLDPGHGGPAAGAIGPSGLTEKAANLQQAKAVCAVLKKAGFHVLMTRDSDADIDLYERARLAYRQKADAFISIHHNAPPPAVNPENVRHVSTYAWNDIGLRLARALHPPIAAITPIDDRGVMTASFAVCRNPAIPSCLLELDFINCPEGEESILNTDHQQKVAEAILAGIRDWLSPSNR